MRTISPPQAWRVLAATLAPHTDETWRFLQKETFHTWVIDTEDY
ncbi:MAG TPA: hypothetical protein VML55_08610 [Planctomycetaceae bacterium]|nr:hypothetical protein [Planctomycetaceae bacterium]